MAAKIVSHFIAGYPDEEGSFETACGLAEGGASYLEMQIPFSDPSADGPVIENACREALARGFRVERAFSLMERIAAATGLPLFLMSYGNILFSRGLGEFVRRAAQSGSAGLIVPDLVYARDEGLYEEGEKQGIPVLPVVTPSVPEERLAALLRLEQPWLYAALRSGITGGYTSIDGESLALLKRLSAEGSKVMAGFGISEAEQVRRLAPRCEAVVAGSVFVRAAGKAFKEGRSLRRAAAETISGLLA